MYIIRRSQLSLQLEPLAIEKASVNVIRCFQFLKRMPNMEIEVLLKTSYGTPKFYPINNNAKTICELMHAKCLSKDQLLICKKADWTITVKQEDFKLE